MSALEQAGMILLAVVGLLFLAIVSVLPSLSADVPTDPVIVVQETVR